MANGNFARPKGVLLEKCEIGGGVFHGFDWSRWTTGTPAQRLALIPPAQEHILEQEDGKSRSCQAVTRFSQAFALCAAHDVVKRIRDDGQLGQLGAIHERCVKTWLAARPAHCGLARIIHGPGSFGARCIIPTRRASEDNPLWSPRLRVGLV